MSEVIYNFADLLGPKMNKDRLRRRGRPTTSCSVVQTSTSCSNSGGLVISSSNVSDHAVHRSLSLPAVVTVSTTILVWCYLVACT